MDHSKALTHVSLCTGYAGLDLGLRRALKAIRTIAYVEIDVYVLANLVTKIEQGLLDACPLYTDVKTFPWRSYHRKVDVLSGGFPCQPFSGAGWRDADRDPRHLFPYIYRGIKELGRPPIVFFENVEGILTTRLKGEGWADPAGTPVLQHVLRELERLGYRATAGLFSAREVGAPHKRNRIFIMGVRSDLSDEGQAIISRLLNDTGQTACGAVYPTTRGAEQYGWEPPRVTMGNPYRERLQRGIFKTEPRTSQTRSRVDVTRSSALWDVQRQSKPPMGRGVNGAPDWLDYAKLCYSVDSRVDEIRMLGNGVVPAVAERAFRVLFKRLSGEAEDSATP